MLKKTVGLIAMGAFLALSTSSVVNAETGYCTGVTIVEVGAKTVAGVARDAILLKNTNTGTCGNWAKNASLWFYLDTPNQDAMLATGLTALSLTSPVTVVSKTGDTYANWGTLVHVSVTAQ